MARIQPTATGAEEQDSSTENTEPNEDQESTQDEQAEETEPTEAPDESTEAGEERDEAASDREDEPSTEDRIAHVHSVLTTAAEETDSATGTVPLAQLAAIGTAVRTVRGNARVEAVSTWSVAAFTGGELDPIAIGAVIAAANNPTTSKPTAPVVAAHEVLAYRLALLELAAEQLKVAARVAQGDVDDENDVVELALEHWTSDEFDLPVTVAERADKVAAEASKGTGRRTSSGGHDGPRADLCSLLVGAMEDYEDESRIGFVHVKTAVVAAGGSQGGALDNRFAALVKATENDGADMTAATRTIYEAGVRAQATDDGSRWFYRVAA